jgi:hypothetical protein
MIPPSVLKKRVVWVLNVSAGHVKGKVSSTSIS